MTLPRPRAPEGSDPSRCPGDRHRESRNPALATALATLLVLALPLARPALAAPTSEDCLECHGEDDITMERGGRTVSLTVNPAILRGSAHAKLACVECHVGFDPEETPHKAEITPVQCGSCHKEIAELHAKSLHGQALARGDKLAPGCKDCHGRHDVLPVKDFRSPVAPLNVPMLCGKCHQEGAPVQRQRPIHQDHILENFSESIHGEALLKKGLIVAPNCASCHTAHSILPHTDPASSIARRNIATTCTKCHAEIEVVHRKVIRGELWEKEAHVLPACVDCHQPHKIRKVFYDQGMADKDCMRCHADPALKSSADGRSLFVRAEDLAASRHAKTACSQCHSDVTASRLRPCETIKQKVDCSSCHAEIGQEYAASEHGQLFAKKDANAPTCEECHGTHRILGKAEPASATFPTNVPQLCARCHREGEKAARRYKGSQHDIIEHYTESIHGKGLNQSGLTVTAMCTSCHTAHSVLPKDDPASSVNRSRIPSTCGRCHHGVEEMFEKSVHATQVGKTKKPLPVCSDCHTAHTISRTDMTGFKLDIMAKCGRCHEDIAKTYFDTYHGKVSQLGYTKTAKCYDCHGAHDILPSDDPRSHLSHANVVKTCQKCHAGATRRFAGYLTHATHHDPKKYPFLFWTFWGMTSLLIATFTVGGIHTALWLPRALAMRRERAAAVEAAARAAAGEGPKGDAAGAPEAGAGDGAKEPEPPEEGAPRGA
ncbi:MAG TPA: cytochrome c3 family protein [Candidatus Eisenbacteria bacterium]